jgi:hypothetical protein
MVNKIFLIALSTIVLFSINYAQATYCEDEPNFVTFPYQYNSSIESPHPTNLTGKVIVVTGGVSKANMLGQAGMFAWITTNVDKAIVFTISTNPAIHGVVNWHHFVGNITCHEDVVAYVAYVKFTLKTQYRMSNPKVDVFALIAGALEWAYGQDNSYLTQRALIDNNYGGNYDVWDTARSSNFDLLHNTTITGWTVSTAAFGPTGNTKGYDQSKVLIWNHIHQEIEDDMRNGSGRYTYGLFPDSVSNTSITCNTRTPLVPIEECAALNAGGRAFCPFPIFPGQTTAYDTAMMHRAIIRGANPSASFFVVNSPTAVDPEGGNWGDWIKLRYNASPQCYARTWLDKFFRQAPQCTKPVGPRFLF